MTTAKNLQNTRYPLTELGDTVEYSVTTFERGDALHVSTAVIVNGHIVHDTVRNGRCSVGDVIRESQIIEACGNDTLHAFTSHLALKWHGNAIRAGRMVQASKTQARAQQRAIVQDVVNNIHHTHTYTSRVNTGNRTRKRTSGFSKPCKL